MKSEKIWPGFAKFAPAPHWRTGAWFSNLHCPCRIRTILWLEEIKEGMFCPLNIIWVVHKQGNILRWQKALLSLVEGPKRFSKKCNFLARTKQVLWLKRMKEGIFSPLKIVWKPNKGRISLDLQNRSCPSLKDRSLNSEFALSSQDLSDFTIWRGQKKYVLPVEYNLNRPQRRESTQVALGAPVPLQGTRAIFSQDKLRAKAKQVLCLKWMKRGVIGTMKIISKASKTQVSS